jgi:hypothetical protein
MKNNSKYSIVGRVSPKGVTRRSVYILSGYGANAPNPTYGT